jgi:hypothetical protein
MFQHGSPVHFFLASSSAPSVALCRSLSLSVALSRTITRVLALSLTSCSHFLSLSFSLILSLPLVERQSGGSEVGDRVEIRARIGATGRERERARERERESELFGRIVSESISHICTYMYMYI